jgi:hypothetical protein
MKKKLQIFVSSTFTDLQFERQAAVQAILKAGHIPAGMELFTASDKSQWDTIKRWIDESDVYMLILGGRYGSVEPTSGVSYTELEYDYAVDVGKPLFAVVIKEDALEAKVKAVGTSVMEKDNPSLLKAFRNKVLLNISSFFSDDRDIRLAVHESLADFRDHPEVIGWVSASEVEDTKPLHDEIARLREELKTAKAARSQPANRGKRNDPDPEKFDEIALVLKKTMITVSSEVTGGDAREMSLLKLLLASADQLTNGVFNGTSTPLAKLLYNQVFPKLIIHNLAQNEKPSGSAYRRSFLNEGGRALLAYLQTKAIIEKDNSAAKAGVENT